MIQLIYTVHKAGSFLHILDALSSWDIHTREGVKDYFQKQYGISSTERLALKRYAHIRKKYPWKLLDSDFYPYQHISTAKLRYQKRLTRSECKELNTIIEIFTPKFNLFFSAWKYALEKRKADLEQETTRHDLRALLSEIVQFYGAKKVPRKVFVHLVVNPNEHDSGGGANILPLRHVTLEPKNLLTPDNKYLLEDILVVVHEVLHLLEHTATANLKRFERAASKAGVNFEILREAIADTLVPDGCLALKYKLCTSPKILSFKGIRKISQYEHSEPSVFYEKSRHKLSALLYPITRAHIQRGKSLYEGDFMQKCIAVYCRMKEMDC